MKFSIWTNFLFYETDLWFGKLTWVYTTNVLIKNVVILMDTKSGNGVEAWLTMARPDHSWNSPQGSGVRFNKLMEEIPNIAPIIVSKEEFLIAVTNIHTSYMQY